MIKELLNQPGAVKYFADLDFSDNKELQDIVMLAAQLCGTPVALITFLVGDEQLIKVKVGTSLERTHREDAFCRHITEANTILIVPNAIEDARFADNPFVAGAPHIRTYAGYPLSTDSGEILGSLCVLSSEVQPIDAGQRQALAILSRQAYKLMELELNNALLKQHAKELERQKQEIISSSYKLRAIFESSPDCFMLLDHDLNLIAFNKSLRSFIKKEKNFTLHIGLNIVGFVNPMLMPIYSKQCQRALEQGRTSVKESKVMYGDKKIWWRLSFSPARNSDGQIIGVTVNSKDISQRKKFEEKVLQQNESLRKIAFMQSHELRRPLANILGLISLIKQHEPSGELYDKLEVSAKELDEKLRYAAKYSEQYDHMSDYYRDINSL